MRADHRASGRRVRRGAVAAPADAVEYIVRRGSAKEVRGYRVLLLVPAAGRDGRLVDAALAEGGQRLVGGLLLAEGLLQQPVRVLYPRSWA